MKKTPDYTVEKTVETILIYQVLEYAPASITKIIERVGYIPKLNRKIKPDAARRILITLEMLGYAKVDEKSKLWSKSSKSL